MIAETKNFGEVRLIQILKLIKSSKYSIHDLSRTERHKTPRFNMPFELGLDLGFSKFSSERVYRNRVSIVLSKDQYQYRRFISDLAGCDISCHKNDPYFLVKELRDWFSRQRRTKSLDGHQIVWDLFNEFEYDYKVAMKEQGYNTVSSIRNIPVSDFIKHTRTWIKSYKKSNA